MPKNQLMVPILHRGIMPFGVRRCCVKLFVVEIFFPRASNINKNFLHFYSQGPTGRQQRLRHPKVQKIFKKTTTISSTFRRSMTRPSSRSPTCWQTHFEMRSNVTCRAPKSCCHASSYRGSALKCCLAATRRHVALGDATLSSSSRTKWDSRDKSHQQRLIRTLFRHSNSS